MAFLWLINGGDPNHLLSGMILQMRGEWTFITKGWMIFVKIKSPNTNMTMNKNTILNRRYVFKQLFFPLLKKK